MLKNYFKIAWRNLLHRKNYAIIRILSLALGLTVFLLVVLYVNHERRYDRWDASLADVYRVGVSERNQQGIENSPSIPFPLGTFLSDNCPEIKTVTRVRTDGETLVSTEDQGYYEKKVIQADSNFFSVFPFHTVQGNLGKALQEPYKAVLSKEISRKLFGKEDPIGKAIHINQQQTYTVTAIIEKLGPSHLDFDICLSYHANNFVDNWFMANHDTYVKLHPNSSIIHLEKRASDVYAKHHAASYMPNGKGSEDPVQWLAKEQGITNLGVFFEPIRNIHLHPKGFLPWSAQIPAYDFNPYNQLPVTVFSFIGILVLSLACINYTNLAIIRENKQIKESGIRKMMGASGRQLLVQYLLNCFIECLFAVGLSLIVVFAVQHQLNSTFQLQLSLWDGSSAHQNGLLIGQLIIITLSTTFLAGIYPAVVLSSYHPIKILKRDFTKGLKGNWFRNSLIVIQYSIACCFIISMLIIALQIHFMHQHNPGFQTEQVLRIQANHTKLFPGQKGDRSVQIIYDLEQLPNVRQVTTGEIYPGMSLGSIQDATYDVDKTLPLQFGLVNFDYIEVLGMPILSGRSFSPRYARDSIDAAIINETAAKQLGWDKPIGEELTYMNRNYHIIGLVKDGYFSGYEQAILPQIYLMGVDNPLNFAGHSQIFIKLKSQHAEQTLKTITSYWKKIEPNYPIRYSWLDNDFNALLEKYERFGNLMAWLTTVALAVAIMGIFALSAFSIKQQVKEIGIRKILGASVSGIVSLLSRDFMKLVLLAVLFASPIAWFAMNKWLENFAYKIDIQWWMFAVAGLIAIVVASLTVSYQAIKAAMANPVESLRNE